MLDVSMHSQNNQEIMSLVWRDFMIEPVADINEEEQMLAYLADVIEHMMTHKMDFLLSLLYRLDVAEEKINDALSPANILPAHVALAHVVWARQKQRMATKRAFRKQNTDNWAWEEDF